MPTSSSSGTRRSNWRKALLARIRTATKYYSELEDADGVELRAHGTPLYASLFAFDQELLVTPHLYRTPGSKAPLLHLRRRGPDGLYANYREHLERIWAEARHLGAGRTDQEAVERREEPSSVSARA